jgi:hypothetical protein
MIYAAVNMVFLLDFSVRSRNIGVLNILHLLFADDTLIVVGLTQITFVFYIVCSYILKLSQV